ncbi:Tetratricopeptide repeat-containing protein [Paenibacillus sp. UNCCL117]|uniref:methyltransferase domain-containing protein n=1 Tax=unclassified Paenibacillus TaxID=185978 RepID=UPI00088DD06F|nr:MULTISPECIES: methyltransferase domain-containing protein [unclassified Paenibacillus]SDE46906.1 Tetratricopeptide repeat-containing protein [Paenibacillus sp. cl123]SFW65773.1 Tetratricopeptide repeat-containing protein [Paenibacillus sp. UNCCL117]
MFTHRILIASPIRQTPSILREFLASLSELEHGNIQVDYIFSDDNLEDESSELLARFAESHGRAVIVDRRTRQEEQSYDRDERTHYWKESQVWKVAALKDELIGYAREGKYEHIFLIDSDLVLHPSTLMRLVETDKDIVSCIYWTQWEPDTMEMPQVWLQDEYTQHRLERKEIIESAEKQRRVKQFYAQLRIPGLYEVGGLGACTLVSSRALEAGVSFKEIKNVSFWGEDRHFCIRAQALGFDLYVDTVFPAYHIYRSADLAGVEAFKWSCRELHADRRAPVAMDSMEPNRWYETAEAMWAYGYEEAAAVYYVRFLDSAEGTSAQRLRACVQAAVCFELLSDPAREKELLHNYLSEFPRPELFCRLGFLCMQNAEWEEAIVWYKLALKSRPGADIAESPEPGAWTWQPHLQLCVCYDQLGQYKLAMKHNELGLELEPDHQSFLMNRDYLLRRLAETSESQATILPAGEIPEEAYVSRFISAGDAKVGHFVYELPEAWWSRGYEYAWAAQFARAEDVVLDAASGVCHPLKFYLNKAAKQTFACDLDPRITSREAILEDIREHAGERSRREFDSSLLNGLHLSRADLTQLPYSDKQFDKIFCISVLEHLEDTVQLQALIEFARVLKDEGLIILTVDYPNVQIERFMKLMYVTRLKFHGGWDFSIPQDAVASSRWGTELKCIRLLLSKEA